MKHVMKRLCCVLLISASMQMKSELSDYTRPDDEGLVGSTKQGVTSIPAMWRSQSVFLDQIFTDGWGVLRPLRRYDPTKDMYGDFGKTWATEREKIYNYLRISNIPLYKKYYSLIREADTLLFDTIRTVYEDYMRLRFVSFQAQREGISEDSLRKGGQFDDTLVDREDLDSNRRFLKLKRRLTKELSPIIDQLQKMVQDVSREESTSRDAIVSHEPRSARELLVHYGHYLINVLYNIIHKALPAIDLARRESRAQARVRISKRHSSDISEKSDKRTRIW